MRRATLFAVLPWLLCCGIALQAETPLKHIRVIVDTSSSLVKNDPSGHVKLATELLFDLALKELDHNDTFKVARFPERNDPGWPRTSTPPQTLDANKYVINPKDDPAGFHLKVRGFHYTSEWTYFSPCIQWALDDLKATSNNSSKDNRVIVLITDGLPDDFAEKEDGARLAALVKPLRDNNIRVFVLAFGPKIDEDWFKRAFQFEQVSGVKGQVFAGADTSHLLTDMLQIFSISFGFSKQIIRSVSDPIDVAKDLTLPRAVVVALYQQPGRPDFELIAPLNKSLGLTHAETEAAEHDPLARAKDWKDVSYAYQWLEPPLKGNYRFETNGAVPSEVAVLRPVHVDAKIRAFQGNSTEVVMADKKAPMEVLVSPANGTTGDPGEDIRVRFYQKYFSPADRGRDSQQVVPSDDEKGKRTPEGRVFVIHPKFIKNPVGAPADKAYYDGFIDVEVVQYDTPVGRMAHMHPVIVYPFISVGVSPNEATARTKDGREIVNGGQDGCVSMHFVYNPSDLKAERYVLAARLVDAPGSSGAWRGSKFRLDGADLDGAPGSAPKEIKVIEAHRLGEPTHSFCVAVGAPSSADSREVKVHFGLWREGADDKEKELDVVEDLVVKIAIAAPDFWQMWRPWFLLLLAALSMYLLWLFLNARRMLAPDLVVSLALAGATSFAPSAAREKSFGMGWLGLPREMPVFSLSGDREIGRVKPSREDLFAFRPGQGYQNVREKTDDIWTPKEPGPDGSYLLCAGKTYQAGSGSNVHLFRFDYSSVQRPKI